MHLKNALQVECLILHNHNLKLNSDYAYNQIENRNIIGVTGLILEHKPLKPS